MLVVAAYPDEGLYVAKAPDDPALRSYADLGVRFVDPGGKDYYRWVFAGMDYVAQAEYMNELAGRLEDAHQVT